MATVKFTLTIRHKEEKDKEFDFGRANFIFKDMYLLQYTVVEERGMNWPVANSFQDFIEQLEHTSNFWNRAINGFYYHIEMEE